MLVVFLLFFLWRIISLLLLLLFYLVILLFFFRLGQIMVVNHLANYFIAIIKYIRNKLIEWNIIMTPFDDPVVDIFGGASNGLINLFDFFDQMSDFGGWISSKYKVNICLGDHRESYFIFHDININNTIDIISIYDQCSLLWVYSIFIASNLWNLYQMSLLSYSLTCLAYISNQYTIICCMFDWINRE